MLAFQVEIDGESFAVAGVEDWSILALHVNAARGDPAADTAFSREDSFDFSVGGLTEADTQGDSYHFRWPRKELHIGSKVTVTIVETDTPDAPIKRYRSDQKVQESPFTEAELRELRWQDYLLLKEEFEGNAKG